MDLGRWQNQNCWGEHGLLFSRTRLMDVPRPCLTFGNMHKGCAEFSVQFLDDASSSRVRSAEENSWLNRYAREGAVPTGVCGQVASAMRGDFPWTRQECVFQGSLEAVFYFSNGVVSSPFRFKAPGCCAARWQRGRRGRNPCSAEVRASATESKRIVPYFTNHMSNDASHYIWDLQAYFSPALYARTFQAYIRVRLSVGLHA